VRLKFTEILWTLSSNLINLRSSVKINETFGSAAANRPTYAKAMASLHHLRCHRDLPRLRHGADVRALMKTFKSLLVGALLTMTFPVLGDPVAVRHIQGYLSGFIVLKGMDDKILASGEVTQLPAGNRITSVLTLHFRDGSLYEERAVFSQRRVFQLLTYKLTQKGPSFKAPETLSFDTASGIVNIETTDKNGKPKSISKHLSLPPDLTNGIITMLLNDIDPTVETTLSMVVSTPEPRIVKLKVSTSGQEPFFIGDSSVKSTHYVMKVDIGGITGIAAKATGKQPPPTHIWIAAENRPVFLKSEGQLYEDGPIWRIEMAAPTWPKAEKK
jgi:hypothetical protein